MGLVAIGAPTPLWMPRGLTTASGATSSITAANDKIAWIFVAPKTGTIDRVRFKTGTVTTGATVDVRVETVTASSGDPSGTLAGTNTNAAQVLVTTTDNNKWFEVTLTAGASVTVGDVLAIVVANPGVSFGSVGFVTNNNDAAGFGYRDLFTAAAWAKGSGMSLAGVRYSDGTYPYIPNFFPEATATASFNSGTTAGSGGDERGNVVTVPFACTVSGFWLPPLTTKAAQDIVLYDASGNVLLTRAFDADQQSGTLGPTIVQFASSDNLVAGQTVRIVQKPGASNVSSMTTTAPAGLGAQFPGATSNVFTFRTDAGAWTNTADKMAMLGLVLSHVDDGVRAAGPMANGRAALMSAL